MFVTASAMLGLIFWHRSPTVTVAWFSLAGLDRGVPSSFWTIPAEILPRSAIAATVGLVNAVGNIAGFAGPYVFGYLTMRTGSFSYGLALMAIGGVGSAVLMLLLPRAGHSPVRAHAPALTPHRFPC